MEIVELNRELEEEWRRYVILSEESTFFHQLEWKEVVLKTYGLIPHYLVARNEVEIRGIFPLFVLKRKGMLISVPFAPYGGPCADSHEIRILLFEKLVEILQKYRARCAEIRLIRRNDYPNASFCDSYVTSILELDRNPEMIWQEKMNGYVRNRTRKAFNNNLKIERGVDHLGDFYDIYIRAIRDLGTPPHPLRFFKNIVSGFPQNIEILVAKKGDTLIGSMFLLLFRDTITNMWSFSLKNYYHYCPNNLLYWEAINYGFEKGYRFFDMGRSLNGTGVLRFKKQWGSHTKQLYYVHFPDENSKIFEYSHANASRQFFSSIWSHMPISLTMAVGPLLRKNFP